MLDQDERTMQAFMVMESEWADYMKAKANE